MYVLQVQTYEKRYYCTKFSVNNLRSEIKIRSLHHFEFCNMICGHKKEIDKIIINLFSGYIFETILLSRK